MKYAENTLKQAVILAGGKGTRLRPITDSIPKPMIKFHNKPFLEYLILQLKEQGLKKILILLGYLPHVIQNYFEDGSALDVEIDYSVTDAENDTGMRLYLAKEKIEPFFIMLYCDNYLPVNFSKMWHAYLNSNTIGQLTVYNNKDNYTKNNLSINNQNIIKIYDKSRTQNILSGVDIGYAIFSKEVFNYLPNKNVNFEAEVYPALTKINKLSSYRTDHRYYSVSNHERLHLTKQFLLNKKNIFLDRDGVLNVKQPKAEYVTNWSKFKWIDGAKEALSILNELNYQIFIITNQAGIARGIMTNNDLDNIHNNMKKDFSLLGIEIVAIYHCPHGWHDGCDCRKPKPGMLYQAQREFHFDLTKSVLIGDDDRDIQAGESAGCKTYLVDAKHSLLNIVKEKIITI